MPPKPTESAEQLEVLAIDSELRSLFSLLDDPDTRVAAAVEERLISRGPSVVMPLMEFVEMCDSALARERAERISVGFSTSILSGEFERLSVRLHKNDRTAFEDGVFLIARFGNPLLKIEDYREELAEFASMLKDRIAGMTSALEVLNEVNHFFFDELRFHGNQTRFLDADNSYIDKVIDRRTGIPISLAIVYLLVTEHRMKLPFSGASAPGHFLIRYDGLRAEPLFVDAFNGGVILRERDIKQYLDSSGLPFNREFLDAASPRSILLRMIRNLIIVFTDQNNQPARAAFESFMRILAPGTEEGHAFLRGLER